MTRKQLAAAALAVALSLTAGAVAAETASVNLGFKSFKQGALEANSEKADR